MFISSLILTKNANATSYPDTYEIIYLEKVMFSMQSNLVGIKKGKGSPYSITERRVPELIPVLLQVT